MGMQQETQGQREWSCAGGEPCSSSFLVREAFVVFFPSNRCSFFFVFGDRCPHPQEVTSEILILSDRTEDVLEICSASARPSRGPWSSGVPSRRDPKRANERASESELQLSRLPTLSFFLGHRAGPSWSPLARGLSPARTRSPVRLLVYLFAVGQQSTSRAVAQNLRIQCREPFTKPPPPKILSLWRHRDWSPCPSKPPPFSIKIPAGRWAR